MPVFERAGRVKGATGYGSPIFSADSSAFVAVCRNYAIKVWDSRTLEPVTGPLPQEHIKSYGLSADGKIAFSSDTNSVRVWDVASSKLISAVRATENQLGFVSISADGKWLVTIANDDKPPVAIWRIGDARPTRWLAQSSPIFSAVFDPSGKWIVTDDGGIHLFGVESGREIFPPVFSDDRHFYLVRIGFDPSGRRVLVPQDCGYTVVETATGKDLSAVRFEFDVNTNRARFSIDGKFISVTTRHNLAYGDARIYDAETGQLRHEIGSGVGDCWIGPGGRWALLQPYEDESKLELWDLNAGVKSQAIGYISYISPDCSLLLSVEDKELADAWRLKH
jgi:WD40 repeat protein